MLDDATLLRRYAEEKSEEAFAELVRRHLDLVYSTALRHLSGDAHLAQDVAQSVFTALARKAPSLIGHAALAGWLYLGAHHAAAQAVRGERRRHAREQEAHTMQQSFSSSSPEADWTRVRPVLDEAMRELTEPDREAVLLRYFEKRPFADIGATLKVSDDAARMRVERALEKLRALLAKHEITSASAALAAVLANQAIATAPVGLAASITSAALTGAAVVEAGAVAVVIAFMTATKTTAVLGVAAALTIATALYQSNEVRASAATLASEASAHAAARARLTDVETQARAAAQALAERERAVAQLAAINAAPKPPVVAAAAASEAAKQQEALQQFLDNDPQMLSLKGEAERTYLRKIHGPFLRGIGFGPKLIEQVIAYEVQASQWKKAELSTEVTPQEFDPNHARFRALFGDAAAERFVDYEKTRWQAGAGIVSDLAAATSHTDEPFTAQQTKRLFEIVLNAKTSDDKSLDPLARVDWDRILIEAEPILSAGQLQGLRAQAAIGRMEAQFAAVAKAPAASPKP